MSTLKNLIVDELQDLLHAENQLVKALPKMAKAARSPELKKAFENHLQETESHVERLKDIFGLLGEKAKAKPCKGMAGLVAEGQEIITEGKKKEDFESDLGIIAAAQKVEHYEISGYGTVRAMAEELGAKPIVQLLSATLKEEEAADKLLTKVSQPLLEQAKEEEEDLVAHSR